MRAVAKHGELAPAIAALVKLEQTAAHNMGLEVGKEPRVYKWMGEWSGAAPELPAIWNWIEPSDYELVDMARADDIILLRVFVVEAPSPGSAQTMDRLVDLMDIFRRTVDPALDTKPVLPNDAGEGTVREGRRVVTQSEAFEFNKLPCVGLSTLLRLDLAAIIK